MINLKKLRNRRDKASRFKEDLFDFYNENWDKLVAALEVHLPKQEENEEIVWTLSEWHYSPDACSAYFYGYTADVYPNEDGNWVAKVDVTEEISEYPECCSINFYSDKISAIAEAELKLREVVNHYDER